MANDEENINIVIKKSHSIHSLGEPLIPLVLAEVGLMLEITYRHIS